jgi:uncharacterized OB-fold protein
MALEKAEIETRVVHDAWDLGLYKWKVEADGLRILVDGLKEGRILGRTCDRCGLVYVPAVSYCRKCFIDIDRLIEVKQTGTVRTFTVNLADVRGNVMEEPQVIGCFQLDGADSWLMGVLVIDDWKKVRVGLRVRIHLRAELKGELADIEYWEPLPVP